MRVETVVSDTQGLEAVCLRCKASPSPDCNICGGEVHVSLAPGSRHTWDVSFDAWIKREKNDPGALGKGR